MKRQRPAREARPQVRQSSRLNRAGETEPHNHEAWPREQRPQGKLVRIAGLPSVAEVFRSAPDRVERLYFNGDTKAQVESWCAHLARRRKVYRMVGADELQRVAGSAMHGGVVALVHPRPVRDLDLSAAATWAAAGKPLLVLDGIDNPQNVGAIARTAGFFGVEHVAFTSHSAQASLSDASYRVAKGALEHIAIHRIANTAETLRRLGAVYDVVGVAIGTGKELKDIAKTGKPIALVMGSEDVGLEPATLEACSSIVCLAGAAKVRSLNVSATAAILIHALLARPR